MNSADNICKISICALKVGEDQDTSGCISANNCIIREWLTIFDHNEEGHTLSVQIADEGYFSKLSIVGEKLKKQFPQMYNGIKFLENIPKDTKFVLLLGDVTEDDTLNNSFKIQKMLHQLNGIEFPFADGMIADSYNIYAFGGKKIYIGESDKNKRVCRFCGQSYPKVKFSKTAHAISESLGNKLLFCNEECDKCNEYFGNSIERDIFKVHEFTLILYGQRGKEGQRNLIGKTIGIDNKKSGMVSIKLNQKFTPNFDDIKLEINEPSLRYIPQNVYKCLSKFAISLINRKYLSNLTKTIEWITSNEMPTALPPVWSKASAINTQPAMELYVKKECTNKNIPDFVLRLYIGDTEYLFVFPYIDNELTKITDEAKRCMEDLFKLNDYSEMNLSSGDKQNIPISFNLRLQEGSEIANVNKSEFESLSEEERVSKYPNASAFRLIDDSRK